MAFNLETTGLDTGSDRIVEFNAVGVPSQPTLRCNLSHNWQSQHCTAAVHLRVHIVESAVQHHEQCLLFDWPRVRHIMEQQHACGCAARSPYSGTLQTMACTVWGHVCIGMQPCREFAHAHVVRCAWSQMGHLSRCGNWCIPDSPCQQQQRLSMASPTTTSQVQVSMKLEPSMFWAAAAVLCNKQ